MVTKMKAIKFAAKIEKSPNPGGWHYVLIGDEVREKLREMTGKNGNVPVLMSTGASSWPSTTMSLGNQKWFVAIKAEVRKTENISEGDIISLAISPDQTRLK